MPSSFIRNFGHVTPFGVNSSFEQSGGMLPSTVDLAPASVAAEATLRESSAD